MYNWPQKLIIGAAGVVAFGIGAAILVQPSSFYAAYGITVGTNPDLLSELRAPGANLLALGAIMLAGLFRRELTRMSMILGTTVFLAYAFGRTVSLIADGMPSTGILQAAGIELVFGGMCALLLGRGMYSSAHHRKIAHP